MLRKLRMGQIKGAIGIILFCAAVGIWMLCDTGLSCITALMGAKPLTAKAELADIVGKYVSWEVLYPVDEYMETTKTTKINGVSTGTKKDRSSWLVLDEERGICLSVEVPYKRYDEMADQAEVFYDAMEQDQELLETGVKIAGTLEVLEGKSWITINVWQNRWDWIRTRSCITSATAGSTGRVSAMYTASLRSVPCSFCLPCLSSYGR